MGAGAAVLSIGVIRVILSGASRFGLLLAGARGRVVVFLAAAGVAVLWSVVLAGSAQATVTACPAPVITGTTAVVTCSYTGDAQTWTVPPGVTSATFDAQGAQGGDVFGAGGLGGEATANLAVAPAATVTLVAGGQAGTCGSGGFNGGGAGGGTCAGGGGGGASDVRLGGSALTDRVLVAGGGGGGGDVGSSRCGPSNGGSGGGLTGGTGVDAQCGTGAGSGGNQTGTSGSGELGVGSAGTGDEGDGGGGGGGYYGGGGGSGGNPTIGTDAGGGGGGSGFGPAGTTFQTGVHSGNGEVTITYTVPATSQLAQQLVTDSTGVGPGKGLFDKASAIQTAANANQTATACADITNYLGLVKAQAGKKLNSTQAATLTSDANNLAAALGC